MMSANIRTLTDGISTRLWVMDSYDDQTVDTHFRWVKEYGIDAAAIQRFGTHIDGTVREVFLNGNA